MARVLAGLWVVAHLLVVAALPVADAQMEHNDRVVAHWEDADRNDCPPSHGTETCAVCQVLVAGRALPATAASATALPRQLRQPPQHRVPAIATHTFLDGNASRAPPLG